MKLWIPGAKILAAHKDGNLYGGPAKVVWHTTENDPTKTSALNVARYLNSVGSQVHVVWNPTTGEIVQMIPANRAGRGLRNLSGGVQTNGAGSVVFQIEVVGKAKEPFTDGPLKGLSTIVAFLDQLGIPDAWPAGDLKPYPASYGGTRSTSAWAKGGHFGHSQVPENDHGDPGDIDQSKTIGDSKPLPPASAIPPVLTKPVVLILNVGSRGPAVVRVQKIVGATADGVYGPNTKAKVAAWQKAKGLDADGIWGPASEAAYKKSPTLPAAPKPATRTTPFRLPSGHFYGVNDGTKWSHSGAQAADKTAVKRIQKFVGVAQDGVIGPITASKIKYWQKRHGLTADGKVGPATWKKFGL